MRATNNSVQAVGEDVEPEALKEVDGDVMEVEDTEKNLPQNEADDASTPTVLPTEATQLEVEDAGKNLVPNGDEHNAIPVEPTEADTGNGQAADASEPDTSNPDIAETVDPGVALETAANNEPLAGDAALQEDQVTSDDAKEEKPSEEHLVELAASDEAGPATVAPEQETHEPEELPAPETQPPESAEDESATAGQEDSSPVQDSGDALPNIAQPAAESTPTTTPDNTADTEETPENEDHDEFKNFDGMPGDVGEKPSTAPAATTSERVPVKGTLGLPNRGFNGTFMTRGGRIMTPIDMVASCNRLASPESDIDIVQLQGFVASLGPRPKTTIGKDRITPDELEGLVGRLSAPKQDYAAAGRVHRKPVKLKWSMDEKGLLKYDLVELPSKPNSERIEYLVRTAT